MTNPRHDLGLRGEAATARWLTAAGWEVLARRWRTVTGELDLVCRDPDGALVAVEVKVRSSARAGMPAESLDARRLGRLRRALAAYAMERRVSCSSLRIDLVTLTREGSRWRMHHQRAVDAW